MSPKRERKDQGSPSVETTPLLLFLTFLCHLNMEVLSLSSCRNETKPGEDIVFYPGVSPSAAPPNLPKATDRESRLQEGHSGSSFAILLQLHLPSAFRGLRLRWDFPILVPSQGNSTNQRQRLNFPVSSLQAREAWVPLQGPSLEVHSEWDSKARKAANVWASSKGKTKACWLVPQLTLSPHTPRLCVLPIP